MLRNEESMERDFQRYVEIGRDNQAYISGIRHWCKNVEVEPQSRGLYAEITGLPIGTYTVGCPYVNSKTGGMNLRWIISNFLNEHCAGCPHHAPNGDVSWGQGIIDEHVDQTEQARRQSDETNRRIQELRAELRAKSAGMIEQESAEARSVLAYLEAIFSESQSERDEASEFIRQAASIGAELFPIEAARLIATLARTPEYSEAMLPVCAVFGTELTDLAEDLVEMALANIEAGLQVESSAAVLRSVGDAATFPLSPLHIRQLMLSQGHHPLSMVFNREEPNYPSSTWVLVKSFDADGESVTSIACEELESGSDHNRHSVCGAIDLVQQERPGIGLDLLDSLITSLNRYDSDDTHYGPSTKIVPLLRATLMHDPVATDEAIGTAFRSTRPAVQEDFTNVYERLGRSDRNVDENIHPQIPAIVTNGLWKWIRDERIPVEVRHEALRALASTYEFCPSKTADDLESLLGYLAIVSAQEQPPIRPTSLEIPGHPSNEIVEQLERQTDLMKWNSFKRELAECLTTISRHDESVVFQAVADCLDQPLDQMNEDFKVSCVSILAKVATKYEIRPKALPYVWKALMDYGSPGTRAQAIEATANMFGNGISPPPNLAEMVLLSLNDQYVVVHQAALRVVARRPHWFSVGEVCDLLVRLAALLDAYKPKKYLVDDICRSIFAVARKDPRYKTSVLQLVASAFPTGEEFIDQDIVLRMIRFCEPMEANAGVVAKCVAVYLGEHKPNYGNNFGSSKRDQMLAWLRQLPIATFQRVSDDLLTYALKAVKRDDVWVACNFAGVFAHFMDFHRERDVLTTTLRSIPDEPRRAEQRALVQRLTEAATKNAPLQARETEDNRGLTTSR